jgi:hypothetical protein
MNRQQRTAAFFLTLLTIGAIAISPRSALIPFYIWIGFVLLWPGIIFLFNIVDPPDTFRNYEDTDKC